MDLGGELNRLGVRWEGQFHSGRLNHLLQNRVLKQMEEKTNEKEFFMYSVGEVFLKCGHLVVENPRKLPNILKKTLNQVGIKEGVLKGLWIYFNTVRANFEVRLPPIIPLEKTFDYVDTRKNPVFKITKKEGIQYIFSHKTAMRINLEYQRRLEETIGEHINALNDLEELQDYFEKIESLIKQKISQLANQEAQQKAKQIIEK